MPCSIISLCQSSHVCVDLGLDPCLSVRRVATGFVVEAHHPKVKELVNKFKDVFQFVLYIGGRLVVFLLLLFALYRLFVQQKRLVNPEKALESLVWVLAIHIRARLLITRKLYEHYGVPIELTDLVQLSLYGRVLFGRRHFVCEQFD